MSQPPCLAGLLLFLLPCCLTLLSGCVSEPTKAFSEARIEAVCAWHERCETFSATGFQDDADCRSTLANNSRQSGYGQACKDFSENDAADCIAAWDDADCETPPELGSCEQVCAN